MKRILPWLTLGSVMVLLAAVLIAPAGTYQITSGSYVERVGDRRGEQIEGLFMVNTRTGKTWFFESRMNDREGVVREWKEMEFRMIEE